MEISVKMDLAMEVKLAATVADVKDDIHKRYGFLPMQQRMFLDGKELDDGCALSDGNSLEVKFCDEVSVRLNQSNDIFWVPFLVSDNVAKLKQTIEEMKGFKVEDQTLMYNGLELQDGLLGDHNVTKGSVVQLFTDIWTSDMFYEPHVPDRIGE